MNTRQASAFWFFVFASFNRPPGFGFGEKLCHLPMFGLISILDPDLSYWSAGGWNE
jgi:hypothetical protein